MFKTSEPFLFLQISEDEHQQKYLILKMKYFFLG
jgi:hypothetical protein